MVMRGSFFYCARWLAGERAKSAELPMGMNHAFFAENELEH
jgi:hypothetical protein